MNIAKAKIAKINLRKMKWGVISRWYVRSYLRSNYDQINNIIKIKKLKEPIRLSRLEMCKFIVLNKHFKKLWIQCHPGSEWDGNVNKIIKSLYRIAKDGSRFASTTTIPGLGIISSLPGTMRTGKFRIK
jgi:hypothetical protein